MTRIGGSLVRQRADQTVDPRVHRGHGGGARIRPELREATVDHDRRVLREPEAGAHGTTSV